MSLAESVVVERLQAELHRVNTEAQRYERQRNIAQSGLRFISTAGAAYEDDAFGRAYLDAGGGYEGLQAVARAALDLADA